MENPSHVEDEGALHRYRTEIPNTVVRGLASRDISVYAKWLYVYLKSVAGDQGTCFQSETMLAKGSGISRTQVGRARRELHTTGLIQYTAGNKKNRETGRIRIIDIWLRNMQEFSVPGRDTDQEDPQTDFTTRNTIGVPGRDTPSTSSVPTRDSSVPTRAHKKIPLRRRGSKKDPLPLASLAIPMEASDIDVENNSETVASQPAASKPPKRIKTSFPDDPEQQAAVKKAIFDTDFHIWWAKKGLFLDLEEQWERFQGKALANDYRYASWRQAFMNWLTSDFQTRSPRARVDTTPRTGYSLLDALQQMDAQKESTT